MINKKEFRISLASLAIFTAVNANGQERKTSEPPSSRPNIVFFFIDDLGYRDLGCYGSEFFETPNIDKLCHAGKKFTHAYVAAAVCSPSRAAALTGKHCLGQGLWNASHRVKKNTLIFPKLLSENGYQTWHLGKWHMGRKADGTSPVDLGFDSGKGGDESWDPGSHFWPYRNKQNPNHKGLMVPDFTEGGKEGEYLADRLTDEAIKLIDQRDKRKPFYLNLWHYGVHFPHEAKPEKIKKYRQKLEKLDYAKIPSLIDPVTQAKYLQEPNSAVYAAMVESIDGSVGKIVEHLKKQGLFENTFFIFFSDNGPVGTTTVKPFRGYKNSLYEGGVRVPAFFTWQKGIKPGISEQRIWALDLFCTILSVANVPVPQELKRDEGVTLLPTLLADQPVPKREFYWYFPEDRPHWGQRASAVLLDKNDMKYHLFFGEFKPELYDLKKDPGETMNLAEKQPEKAKELHETLCTRMRALYPAMPKPEGEFKPIIPHIEEKIGLKGVLPQ